MITTTSPVLVLSDLTADFNNFSSQFSNYTSSNSAWQGNLTTQTSQTLIELCSSVGVFMQGRLLRAYEDSFSETAQNDDAIRAIAIMQGLRMSRKLPATLTASLTSTTGAGYPPLTQFTIAGQYYFNRTQLTLAANTATSVTLYEGKVVAYMLNGLGTPRQTFVSQEDSFTVSDQDVNVLINNTIINKALGGMWNYRSQAAFSDMTTADGRLLVVFGNSVFGSIPQTTDSVVIAYPITQGADANAQLLINKPVQNPNDSTLSGTVTSNPTGGASEQSTLAYKNLSAGSFGTYNSAVTQAQYQSLVGTYPGIVDAYVQAQRDIDPSNLQWMNVMRISALTTSPWTIQQKTDFLNYVQSVSMYSSYFVWQDPVAVVNNVSVDVYCYNTAVLSNTQAACVSAIQAMFAPQPGILMTNFYTSDLESVCKAAGQGSVAYVIVTAPTEPMIVAGSPSASGANSGSTTNTTTAAQVIQASSQLPAGVYVYGVGYLNAAGVPVIPSTWVYPNVTGTNTQEVQLTWPAITGATAYFVWGRTVTGIGVLETLDTAGNYYTALLSKFSFSVTAMNNPDLAAYAEVTVHYTVAAGSAATGERLWMTLNYYGAGNQLLAGMVPQMLQTYDGGDDIITFPVNKVTGGAYATVILQLGPNDEQQGYGNIVAVMSIDIVNLVASGPISNFSYVDNGTQSVGTAHDSTGNVITPPTPGSSGAAPVSVVQYNTLGTLTVNTYYASRQQHIQNT